MSVRTTAELQGDLLSADGGPLSGAAYSNVVPTLAHGRPEVVGFLYGFKVEPSGGATFDGPSDVRFLDAKSGALTSKERYQGLRAESPAPTNDAAAAARLSALQDRLAPPFLAGAPSPPTALGPDALEYTALFPRAVGAAHVRYYQELAPDWFDWLKKSGK